MCSSTPHHLWEMESYAKAVGGRLVLKGKGEVTLYVPALMCFHDLPGMIVGCPSRVGVGVASVWGAGLGPTLGLRNCFTPRATRSLYPLTVAAPGATSVSSCINTIT